MPLNFQDINTPPDPNAPKRYNAIAARQDLEASRAFSRQPNYVFVEKLVEHLRLADAELGATAQTVNNAQNEALKYQREAEQANIECRRLREEIAALRAAPPPPPVAVAAPAAAPKKRGRPANVVDMPTEQKKAL